MLQMVSDDIFTHYSDDDDTLTAMFEKSLSLTSALVQVEKGLAEIKGVQGQMNDSAS